MSASFVHQLFRLWNLAAATELEVRIQGPLLSFPFGIHYRIVYIDQPYDCGLPCRGNPPKPINPAYTYPGPLDLPTDPRERVYDKYLQCEYRQFGRKPAWVHDRDNATEVNTYSRCPSAAPGREWESIWAT